MMDNLNLKPQFGRKKIKVKSAKKVKESE